MLKHINIPKRHKKPVIKIIFLQNYYIRGQPQAVGGQNWGCCNDISSSDLKVMEADFLSYCDFSYLAVIGIIIWYQRHQRRPAHHLREIRSQEQFRLLLVFIVNQRKSTVSIEKHLISLFFLLCQIVTFMEVIGKIQIHFRKCNDQNCTLSYYSKFLSLKVTIS